MGNDGVERAAHLGRGLLWASPGIAWPFPTTEVVVLRTQGLRRGKGRDRRARARREWGERATAATVIAAVVVAASENGEGGGGGEGEKLWQQQ